MRRASEDGGASGSVLIIDDEPVMHDVLRTLLRKEGFVTHHAHTAEAGMNSISEEEVDVILLDLMLPDKSGLELLKELTASVPQVPVIVITAYSSVESAISAMKLGAYHYIAKPFKNEELLNMVQKALERKRLLEENERLRSGAIDSVDSVSSFPAFQSRAMRQVVETAKKAAPSEASVLLLGEPGTGKETLARAIHGWSPRRSGPFVVIRPEAPEMEVLEQRVFGSLSPGQQAPSDGLLQAASNGTLFIKRVDKLPMKLQERLAAWAVEGDEADGFSRPRLIASSEEDLARLSREGRFLTELYYRLAAITIKVPPLRERKEDVPLIASSLLGKYAAKNAKRVDGFTGEAMELLISYHWPGNLVELEAAIERAVALVRDGESIDREHLPPHLAAGACAGILRLDSIPEEGIDFRQTIAECQRELIRLALKTAGGVQRRAAQLLKLSPKTLNDMMKRLGLDKES